MAGTLTAPTPGSAQDFGAEAGFILQGTGTENDGKRVRVSAAIDPLTGLPVTTQPITGTKGAFVDRSGTITTGGTAQSLAPANAARNYLLIQNPTTASLSFWVDFGGTSAVRASPSVEIAPGTTLVWDGLFVPTGAISVNGATGQAYTAKEG